MNAKLACNIEDHTGQKTSDKPSCIHASNLLLDLCTIRTHENQIIFTTRWTSSPHERGNVVCMLVDHLRCGFVSYALKQIPSIVNTAF